MDVPAIHGSETQIRQVKHVMISIKQKKGKKGKKGEKKHDRISVELFNTESKVCHSQDF